jgi:hypothetical protein
MRAIHCLVLIGLLSCHAPTAVERPSPTPDPPAPAAGAAAALDAQVQSEAEAVMIYRQGLQRGLSFLESRPELTSGAARGAAGMLSNEERRLLRTAWQSFFDYCLALDEVKQIHGDFFKDADEASRHARFGLFYAAFLSQYRHALAFLEAVSGDSRLDVVFNEADPELGLEARTYAAFKFRFLNVGIASQFIALNTLRAYHDDGAMPAALQAAMEEDRAFIWKMGQGPGPAMTLGNALRIVRDSGSAAWFPVQKGVSQWMGDTKVWRQARSLVSPEQIQALPAHLQPGDILLERREWYLSNVGLPGFWTHVALYIGTPEERNDYFKDDAETCRWLTVQGVTGCAGEQWLQRQHPRAYALSAADPARAPRPRVIEAIGPGVSITTLEQTAACDSLAVLRPRLPKSEKLRAIERAFQYQGRPYDYNFDFLTDAALVCSELIYKCYEPSREDIGVRLPIVDLMGRKLTPPNDIVRQFDAEYGTSARQVEWVLFYDGIEAQGRALPSTLESFRQSWRRPKWHILLPQETAQ